MFLYCTVFYIVYPSDALFFCDFFSEVLLHFATLYCLKVFFALVLHFAVFLVFYAAVQI